MRTLIIVWAVLGFSLSGCMKTEQMTAEEMMKYPRPTTVPEQKLDPKDLRQPRPETCLEAGKMYESLAQSTEDTMQKRNFGWRAKQAYEQALRLKPGWAPAQAGLARVDEMEGNIQQAAVHFQLALQNISGKDDANVCHQAGLFYARHQQYDNSVACMQRAIQLDPSNRTHMMNYGYTLARAGRFDESYQHFSKIMSPSEASFQLAQMARHMGDAERSKQYASYALQQNPKHTQAQQLLTQLQQPAVQQAEAVSQQ